jgi:hypothetical protein
MILRPDISFNVAENNKYSFSQEIDSNINSMLSTLL